jgi:hypothetical protein
MRTLAHRTNRYTTGTQTDGERMHGKDRYTTGKHTDGERIHGKDRYTTSMELIFHIGLVRVRSQKI